MKLDVDLVIILIFLISTLIIGLKHGNSVKTLKDYALGGREFSTTALVATIVATYASGSGFFLTLSETYQHGFYYLFASTGIGISFFVTAFFLIPRMGEFLGKLSIAEAMGDLYGNKVRLITAIAGSIGSAGLIAVQFKVFGNMVSSFSGLDSNSTILISGIIATIYSTFGGIRAVTFTDILQGFTFGVIIPMLGIVIWSQFHHANLSVASMLSQSKFGLDFLIYGNNDSFWEFAFLFAYFSHPPISPPTFQRISMGSSIAQTKKAFIIAAIFFIIIKIAIVWIPFLIHALNPDIESANLVNYILDTYSFTGLKGGLIIAIIALSISTADSYINSSAILFTHDIYGLFSRNKANELFIARSFACILGCSTIILSLVETDLLSIIIFANSFYYPLVIPPFVLTVFGFRTSTKAVLTGMFVGLFVAAAWRLFLPGNFLPLSQNVLGFLFPMFCNTVFLIGSHYLLRQEGGWVGIKDTTYLDEQKKLKKEKWNNYAQYLSKFSFKELRQNIAPENDLTYTALGLYFIICTITTIYSTHVELLGENASLVKIIYPFMLVTGTSMSMYPIWPLSVATSIKKGIIERWYPIAIFYMLIFFSCFFVIVSKFALLQVLLFAINLLIASLLLGWRLAMPLIIIGFYFSSKFYQYNFQEDYAILQFLTPEFLSIYLVLILSSAILVFLRPEQVYFKERIHDLDEEINHDLEEDAQNLTISSANLNEKIAENDITHLGTTAQKILNNVTHELKLPVGNVLNFVELLNEALDKCNEEQLNTLSEEVSKNPTRLSSTTLNILDLATLDVQKLILHKEKVNFSELVVDRIKKCCEIYINNKPVKFKLIIESEIMISVDPNYMSQMLDNLVINAIQSSEEGIIEINLRTQGTIMIFTISDRGIGITQEDLYDIFTPLKMGANDESKDKRRGAGLTLCKSVITAHEGKITAESKGIGAIFKIVLHQ